MGVLSFGTSGCLEDSVSSPSESLPLYSHDGTWVAFTRSRSGKDEIYVSHSGAPATRLTEFAHRGFDWSPDGSKIVFVRLAEDFGSRGLFVVNRDGGRLRRLTRGEDYWPCWAADGETIVFLSGNHVRAVDVDGTRGRRLIPNADRPACSPTKPAIAFLVIRGSETIGIGVLDLRSGSRRMLLMHPRQTYGSMSPSWSPDGHRIAYHVSRPRLPSDPDFEHRSMFADDDWYLTEIYVADAAGSAPERLTWNAVGDMHPTWLPDGRIAFESNRAGPTDLTNKDTFRYYTIKSDGSGVEPLEWKPEYR